MMPPRARIRNPLAETVTVYLNGAVYTLDPARPLVEAVACAGGRVVAVGRSDELQALARARRDLVDLGGHTVVPGLIDAHLHLLGLGLALGRVDLAGLPSLAACVDRVTLYHRELPPGQPIIGRGWNQNGWPEGRWPACADLDAVTGDRLVAIASKDGHLLWVNTATLRAAGIARDTPDPPGGEIARDAHGEPAGVLKENATKAVYDILPPPTPDEAEEALARAMAHALASGLTGVGTFEDSAVYRALGRLRDQGRLSLRVVSHIAYAELDDALAEGRATGRGDEWLRDGSLKLFADGTLGSQTAAMLEPYEGTNNRGIATLSGEELRDAALRAAAGGIATAIHAIGDGANRTALRALAAVPRVAAAPHRVEHAQALNADDLPIFAAHGIVASMQPIHLVDDRDTAMRYWGPRRCATAYAWRPLLEGGATLAFGSDAPIETCDPLAGLYAAVARHGRGDGRDPWYPELALSVEDAVRAYTRGAAATGEETSRGSLVPGALADMVALSADIFAGAEALGQARVICAIVDGKVVAGGL